MEGASLWSAARHWSVTGNPYHLALAGEIGDCAKQPRCIWMARCGEQLFAGGLFNDTSAVHDRYLIGEFSYHGKVVTDV
jgi:hypothetical protein